MFQCPVDATTLAVCPNNCLGVRPSAIVAGGTALFAGAVTSGLTIAQGILGLGAVSVSGVMLAQTNCLGPLFCRYPIGH